MAIGGFLTTFSYHLAEPSMGSYPMSNQSDDMNDTISAATGAGGQAGKALGLWGMKSEDDFGTYLGDSGTL